MVVSAAYDSERAEMTFATGGPLPPVPPVVAADVDYFGPITGDSPALPGPFADRFARQVVLDFSPLRCSP
jgi:hypothetical protein